MSLPFSVSFLPWCKKNHGRDSRFSRPITETRRLSVKALSWNWTRYKIQAQNWNWNRKSDIASVRIGTGIKFLQIATRFSVKRQKSPFIQKTFFKVKISGIGMETLRLCLSLGSKFESKLCSRFIKSRSRNRNRFLDVLSLETRIIISLLLSMLSLITGIGPKKNFRINPTSLKQFWNS